MQAHLDQCESVNSDDCSDDKYMSVLDRAQTLVKLLTLEALFIAEVKPKLNTKKSSAAWH